MKKHIQDSTNLGGSFASKENSLTCQIVRSLTHWSGGLLNDENSILNAYCTLIDNAKHYIYIQNQYFVSRPYSHDEYKLYNKTHKKSLSWKVINPYRIF